MEAVAVNFLTTKQDFFQFKKASCRAESSRKEIMALRIVGIALILSGLLGCIFLPWGFFAKVGFGLLAAVGVVIGFYYDTLHPYLVLRGAYLSYEINRNRMTAKTIVFEQEEIRIDSERYTAHLPYAMLHRAYEDRHVFLLYIGIGEVHFVPKRALSEEEQTRIQLHLKETMREKYKQEGVR